MLEVFVIRFKSLDMWTLWYLTLTVSEVAPWMNKEEEVWLHLLHFPHSDVFSHSLHVFWLTSECQLSSWGVAVWRSYSWCRSVLHHVHQRWCLCCSLCRSWSIALTIWCLPRCQAVLSGCCRLYDSGSLRTGSTTAWERERERQGEMLQMSLYEFISRVPDYPSSSGVRACCFPRGGLMCCRVLTAWADAARDISSMLKKMLAWSWGTGWMLQRGHGI